MTYELTGNSEPQGRPEATSTVLLRVIRELSLAQSMTDIMSVARVAARQIACADGATFVLQEDGHCFYADEDAIQPLWKGMRFPLKACISGWCMLHKEQLTIADIYADDRIPHDAYRPTFVKSLAMTPIRQEDPLGAIGTYWAKPYVPTKVELEGLQSLADATAAAIANCATMRNLEARVKALEAANQRLSRFTWMASHDLKEPLRGIGVNLSLLEEGFATTAPDNSEAYAAQRQADKASLEKMKVSVIQARNLIADLLVAAQVEEHEKCLRPVDLNQIMADATAALEFQIAETKARLSCEALPQVWADPILLKRVFFNILANALKFQCKEKTPLVDISAKPDGPYWQIAVRDNGIGIEKNQHHKVFEFFTRLHNEALYGGSGVGLALCKKIIDDCGGRIWFESKPGMGSCFFFTLPRNIEGG